MLRQKLICTFILTLVLTSSAYAQDSRIKSIPAFGQMFGVQLSPDGQTVAIFENTVLHNDEIIDKYLPIRLIDVTDGSEKSTFTGASDYAADVAFTPDSAKAASYHVNGFIYLWDTANGRTIKKIGAIPGNAIIEFLPDGKTLAVVQNSSIGQLLLWDTDSGYIQAVLMQRSDSFGEWKEEQFGGSGGPEYYIGFDINPDGSQAAVVTVRGNIWLWDFASGEGHLIRQSVDELPRLEIRNLHFSPDGSSLIYLDSSNDAIHVLEVESGSEMLTIPAPEARQFTVSPDGTMVAWLTQEAVFVSPLAANPTPTSIVLPASGELRVIGPQLYLAFTSDNSQLISGGFGNTRSDDNLIHVITF